MAASGCEGEGPSVGRLLQDARRIYLRLNGEMQKRLDLLVEVKPEVIAWAAEEKRRRERRAEAGEMFEEPKKGRQKPELSEAEVKADDLRKEIDGLEAALKRVMHFDQQLEKAIAERDGRRAGDLDLAAARREILGELARLAERGGA